MTKFSHIAVAVLGVALAMTPVTGFAKDGRSHKSVKKHQTHQTATREPRREREIIVIRDGRSDRHCPPGLAKKSPACEPPGQARKHQRHEVSIGDILNLNHVHMITSPGAYGLGEPPRGNRYAVVDGRLVRVDSDTGRLLSIIRLVTAILD